MEPQFRRGIYRPKAQRLSISLAPLVAQRSLMFRIKTDLTTKASYTELSPMEETPALHSFSESIQIVTATMTAMSAASVYSQESWKSASSFVSMVKVDPKRMAISLGPSVQWWSDIAEGDGDNKVQVTTPSASTLQPDVSFKEDNNTTIHSEADVALSGANDAVHESVRSFDVVTVEKRQTKRNIVEQSAKRPKSAFKKIIFMFQPPKRELVKTDADADAVVVPNNLPSMDFKLPELKLSPMLCSFLDQINTSPLTSSTPSLIASSFDTLVEGDGERAKILPTVVSPENKGHIRCKSSPAATYFPRRDQDKMPPFPPTPAGPLKPRSARIVTRRRKTSAYPSVSRMPSTPSSMNTFVEENTARVRPLRATMPPTISPRNGHRRYRSSPVVTHFRKWDKDNMPPLPPMPAGALTAQ